MKLLPKGNILCVVQVLTTEGILTPSDYMAKNLRVLVLDPRHVVINYGSSPRYTVYKAQPFFLTCCIVLWRA